MLHLLTDKKAVLVNPRAPDRFLKLVPTARKIRHNGQDVIAVPHRMDEMRVLTNFGLKAPSPILRTYDWPRSGKIAEPFEAQKQTAGFLTLRNRAFVLNDLGTGKSLAALWAYDFLRARCEANKLLIICPLSTMERTWADEIFYNLGHLEYRVIHGSKARRLKMLADTDADVYIINHHGVKVVGEELAKRRDIDTVIVDEIAQVCRNKTDIWRAINGVVNGGGVARRAWGLTGTPIPNEPTDAYHQMKLLTPERVKGVYYRTFRDRTMLQINQFKWVPRPDAIDIVDEFMQPAIRYTRDDCIDLPKTIYMTREVQLTPEQKKAYKTMVNQLHAEIQNGEITASNEAVKAGKLVQIACGVVYDNDKVPRLLPTKPRTDEVLALLEQSPTKTIVFVPYRAPLEMIADTIRAAGYDVGVVHGGVSKGARDVVFQSFQNSPNKKHVIVAQPAAMSHGLTLTAASQIVWYAPVTSAETYEQANGRITRPGQKHTPVIVHIEGTEIERRIFMRLRQKQKMQNILLDKKAFA